jgi:hypothetical protein
VTVVSILLAPVAVVALFLRPWVPGAYRVRGIRWGRPPVEAERRSGERPSPERERERAR